MLNLTTQIDIALRADSVDGVQEVVKLINSGLPSVIYLSPAVLWFAMEMQEKLSMPDIKAKGDAFKDAYFVDLHFGLGKAMQKFMHAPFDEEFKELADIANYAMLLAIWHAIKEGKAQ